jgi:leucyl aminopeptidase (aminopeptidase T)
MPNLAPAVAVILDRCLAVKPREEVVVVADPASRTIGEGLRAAAAARYAEAVLVVMDERAEHGNEPPGPVAAALRAANVFIAPTAKSLTHTAARKRACEAGARGATMPGVTEEMLARTMGGDFDLMAARSRVVAELLDVGEEARLTCPLGSDLRIDLRGRRGLADDGDLTSPGAFGNLPCGEGFIAPASGEGTIVGSSIASLGISREPARLTVKRGRLTAAEGGLGPALFERLASHGEAATNMAELGVGTNERARLTGIVLEDEKVLGSAHVAFGASAGIGGTVSVPVHLDVVVLDATLEVDGRLVLESGRFVLDAGRRALELR